MSQDSQKQQLCLPVTLWIAYLLGRMNHQSSCRHETGDFWAVDLGGTNFRTLYINLSDEHGAVVGLTRLWHNIIHDASACSQHSQ